jgi:hypothetical protein
VWYLRLQYYITKQINAALDRAFALIGMQANLSAIQP